MKKLSLVVVVLMAVGLMSSCDKKDKGEEIAVPIYETKGVTYKTVKAEISDISEKYQKKAVYSYPYFELVNFKASGLIESIEVESMADVKKGDLLCTLNTDDIKERIEEKQVYLEQAKQTLNKLWNNDGSSEEIQFAQIDLEIQQLEYQHLVDSLDDYKVYAPCDGVFTMADGHSMDGRGKELNLYSYVNKGDVFGYSADRSKEYLCCEVFDNPLNNVNFGTKVILEQGSNSCGGIVTDVLRNENGDYSTYVYVISPDDDGGLFTFGDVNVVFDVYSRLDTVVLPQKAIKTIGERNFVNLLIDGIKVEQDVELGIVDGQNVEILSGLVGEEEVVLN